MEFEKTIEEIEGRIKEIKEVRDEITGLDEVLENNYLLDVQITGAYPKIRTGISDDAVEVVDKALRKYRRRLYHFLQELIEEVGSVGFKDHPKVDYERISEEDLEISKLKGSSINYR